METIDIEDHEILGLLTYKFDVLEIARDKKKRLKALKHAYENHYKSNKYIYSVMRKMIKNVY